VPGAKDSSVIVLIGSTIDPSPAWQVVDRAHDAFPTTLPMRTIPGALILSDSPPTYVLLSSSPHPFLP